MPIARVAQLEEHQITDLDDAGSTPAASSNHQRVGESGRPYLPWKQGIGGSNPPALTNSRSAATAAVNGACAEGHGYFGKRPESRPATVSATRQVPQSESTLQSAVTSFLHGEWASGPVTALASRSAPLAAVTTSFALS